MSKAIVLQNVAHEGPGRIRPVFNDFGIPVEVRHLYRGDELPSRLDEVRVLVVMGGPLGVADVGSAKYPWLAPELELIKQFVQLDKPLLGICLGAQLLASAAGAKVYQNTRPGASKEAAPIPAPEIGWLPVTFPFPGGTEPMVMGCHDGMMMFHWHFDTFDLPKLPAPSPAPPGPPPPTGNALLCSSKACKNQAFRFKTRLFGFQAHIEMDREGIEAMLEHAAGDVRQVHGDSGFDQIRADTDRYFSSYERITNKVLANFVQFMKVY